MVTCLSEDIQKSSANSRLMQSNRLWAWIAQTRIKPAMHLTNKAQNHKQIMQFEW
jgi:hypothetical protein